MSARDQQWWWDALARWKLRPTRLTPFMHEHRCLIAEVFIPRYWRAATANGWQPAHLLHDRGLTSRWAGFGPPAAIAWEPHLMLFPCATQTMALRAMPDGSVQPLRGGELTAMRGRHIAAEQVWNDSQVWMAA